MEKHKVANTVSSSSQRRMNLLATPLFIFSIGLLALNDFVLKATFHNWLTGKLSDFAGLIAFSLFACAFWPSRRWIVAGAVSASFIYWKSPYSQALIDFSSDLLPFSMGRTVDYSDYLALPGVWVVCYFLFRLRPWPIRNWGLSALAITSLLLFTATTCIQSHKITRTADFSATGRPSSSAIEQELQVFFDSTANKYGLECIICDPLSSGRLYAKDVRNPYSLAMTVNFDSEQAVLYFDASSWGQATTKDIQNVDRLNADIERQIKIRFPNITLQEGERPKAHTVKVTVKKGDIESSQKARAKQEDYAKVVEVVSTVSNKHGMKVSSSAYQADFYAGKLYGLGHHELNIVVRSADWPWIWIEITSRSDRLLELQNTLATEIERELQAYFGKDRASIR